MRKNLLILIQVLLFLSGCSAYKELSPDPEINPEINGYKQILDKKESFEIEKGKKYYIVFKKPIKGNIYLMIENNIKPISEYYFSDNFIAEPKYKKIADLTISDNNLSVFPLDTLHNKFYWVIEKIEKDTLLNAKYRYIESWRFGFERDFARENKLFAKLLVDKEKYRKINLSVKLSEMKKILKNLKSNFDSLTLLKKRTSDMEKYFPDKFRTAKDYDYKKYVILENDVEEEFIFQKKYLALLEVLSKLKESESNTKLFLQNVSYFIDFISRKKGLDNSLTQRIKEILASKLKDVDKYYKELILKKIDAEPFNINPPISEVKKLFEIVNGFVPQNILKYETFFKQFDKQASLLRQYLTYSDELNKYLQNTQKWLPLNYFDKALALINKMAESLPEVHPTNFRNFKQYTCVNILVGKAKELKRSLRKFEREFKESKYALMQINNYKRQNSFDKIITLLRTNKSLGFLRNHYSFLDKEYLNNEIKKIETYLNNKNWRSAESEIKNLYEFNNFIQPKKIKAKKDSYVISKTERLFNLVFLYTKNKIDSIVNENVGSYFNLDSLYSDKNFSPLYVFTFDPENAGKDYAKNLEIRKYIETKKYYELPEKSILKLYNEILRNKNNDGVLKAKAILLHGKYYKGKNRKVKNIIDEFTPTIAKTIKSPKTYRKIYVTPVTDNMKGKNVYKFRVQLKIPTKAKFPVYEINIKLPKEIAKDAQIKKWYDKIVLNKTELKNEGRIKIIAPSASNNYECKISPVQMDSEGKNILEITFTSPTYKIYEISVMAQKPLMRKN